MFSFWKTHSVLQRELNQLETAKVIIFIIIILFNMIEWVTSIQSMRDLGERVLSFFVVKIIAAIFIFTAVEGWGEKEICTEGVSDNQKEG